MGPGEGEDSIPDGIGGEGISGTVNGLGLVDGVIGIIGGEAMGIGGGAIGIGGGVMGMGGGVIGIGGGAIAIGGGVIIGIGGGVIIGIGDITGGGTELPPPLDIGGMDIEPEGAIMGA